MKKQRRQFILLVIVLAALVGGYFALRFYNEKKASEPQTDDTEYLLQLGDDSIIRITYDYQDVEYTFVKEEDTWLYEADKTLNINQNVLDTMASRLEAVEKLAQVDGVTDFSQYGLDEPQKTITFETATESHTFIAGDYNDLSGFVYICESGTDVVYGVPNVTVSAFNKDLESLIEEEEEEESVSDGDAESVSGSDAEGVSDSDAAAEDSGDSDAL